MMFLSTVHVKLQTLGRLQAVSRDWRSCFELIPLKVELRHVEHKYVSYFVCYKSDESEDEEHNKWNTTLGFIVNYELSQRSSGSRRCVLTRALSCRCAQDIFSFTQEPHSDLTRL